MPLFFDLCEIRLESWYLSLDWKWGEKDHRSIYIYILYTSSTCKRNITYDPISTQHAPRIIHALEVPVTLQWNSMEHLSLSNPRSPFCVISNHCWRGTWMNSKYASRAICYSTHSSQASHFCPDHFRSREVWCGDNFFPSQDAIGGWSWSYWLLVHTVLEGRLESTYHKMWFNWFTLQDLIGKKHIQPRKTNMKPETTSLEKEKHLQH